MANNTGLDEADVEPGDLRTPSLPKCKRSLVTPTVKFRILKIHAAETRRGKRPPRWEAPDFPRQRPAHCPLTLGNVGGSPTPGNHTAETALAGWGARIRTWEWRNQNRMLAGKPWSRTGTSCSPTAHRCESSTGRARAVAGSHQLDSFIPRSAHRSRAGGAGQKCFLFG